MDLIGFETDDPHNANVVRPNCAISPFMKL